MLDRQWGGTQPFSDVIDGICGDITRLIELAYQRISNHPVLGGGNGERQLLIEVVAEALSGRNEVVEVVAFSGLLSGHGFPLARELGRIGLSWFAIVGKDVFEAGIQLLAKICGALPVPVIAVGRHAGGRIRNFTVAEIIDIYRRIAAQIAIVCRNFQQRIALHLLRDELRQLEMRHLKQLDGLHQLRCHHERLVLTQQKAGR